MRIRNVKNAKDIIANCDFLIREKKIKYFNNNNPIILEIGMGKGQFLLNMALANPNNNYIGVEKYDSVAARAIEKITPVKPPNLLILIEDAINLNEYFPKMIKTIHLNFSDPWPKKRHAKRRLTSELFLNIYKDLFKNKQHIILKTDNKDLFASSLISFNNAEFIFKEISFDLGNSDIPNIKTEYEDKFSKKGININYLEVVKDDIK